MDKNQYLDVLLKNKLAVSQCLSCLICALCISSQGFSQTYSGKSNSLEVQISDPELLEKSAKPIIRWIYPMESVESLTKETANLKLGISSKSPVVKVTMIINNEVIEIFENFKIEESGYLFDAWLEKSVHLNIGSNDIQLIVQNEQGALKHQRKIDVKITPSTRRNHALIFGIDDYDYFEDLEGPVRDSDKIARVLEERGFTLEIVRNSTTFSLLGKLEEYVAKEFQAHDQLFIYFAGHGYFDSASSEGYFVCKNSVNQSNTNTTYISYDAIKSIINNIPVQHIFMLMDAAKGRGEPLSLVLEQLHEQPETIKPTLSSEARTRIGILSGSSGYEEGVSNNAGSPLSRAFIAHIRTAEQTETPSWRDLILEFEGIDPDPLYIEFGDHDSEGGAPSVPSQSDN